MVNSKTEQDFWSQKLRELQEADYPDSRTSYHDLIDFVEGTVPLTEEAATLAFAWESGLDCAGVDSLSLLFMDLRHYFEKQLKGLVERHNQPTGGIEPGDGK